MDRDLNALARKAFALAVHAAYLQLAPKEEDVSITSQLSSHYECQWTDGNHIIQGSFYSGDDGSGVVCIAYHGSGCSHRYPYSWHHLFDVNRKYTEYLDTIARNASAGNQLVVDLEEEMYWECYGYPDLIG